MNTRSKPHCARFSATDKLWSSMEACDSQVTYTRFVCQLDDPRHPRKHDDDDFRGNTVGGGSPAIPELANPPTDKAADLDVTSVVCPSGHSTHAFLACDVQSACWADGDFLAYRSGSDGGWDVPTSSSCRAPLTSLPPSFRCRTLGQRVPYSVVCDFRPDCLDASDEDFCTFPPCDPHSQFQCNNKQVGLDDVSVNV